MSLRNDSHLRIYRFGIARSFDWYHDDEEHHHIISAMSKVSFVEVNHGDPPHKVRQVFLDEKPELAIKEDNNSSVQKRSGRFRLRNDFYDKVGF